jgi:hypothetical protein
MEQVKLMVKGGLVTLIASLIIISTLVILSEVGQLTLAKVVAQPAAPAAQEAEYLPLTDAVPQRDITVQRFSPLEAQ